MTKIKDECMNLTELKEEYEKYKKKHKIPEFSELNKLFDIEEIDSETDFLLRRIRRVILEKIGGYLRFIETILNPSMAPIFFFKLIKKLDNKDREILGEVYEILGQLDVRAIYLDLDYSEKNEIDFINKSFEIFNNKAKSDLLRIIEKLGHGEDTKKETNSSYCG